MYTKKEKKKKKGDRPTYDPLHTAGLEPALFRTANDSFEENPEHSALTARPNVLLRG
jgi:hypothetical protein